EFYSPTIPQHYTEYHAALRALIKTVRRLEKECGSLRSQLEEAERERERLPIAPDWHDRPTGPGLWATEFGGILRIGRDNMDDAVFLLSENERVYGPIPPPPTKIPSRHQNLPQ